MDKERIQRCLIDTQIYNEERNIHDIVLSSVTGHMVVVGIYNYILPLTSPYFLCFESCEVYFASYFSLKNHSHNFK